MRRRLITGHSPYEGVAGFSRAVVVGDRVHVSGTAPIPADGSPPPDGAYEQARLCLELVGEALRKAGSVT
jgi:enamine deaminase RidA (YjgF/YER057c/UK114 family)